MVQLLHPNALEKTASSAHPLIKQAASELPKRSDGIWVLVNAVCGGEYWGSNTNGDYFPEEALKYACALDASKDQDYGYKTFEKYAYPYRHHVNKDSKRSIGERVKLAVWNDNMKRVELIHFMRRDSEFDDFGDIAKVGAPDLVQQVENGDEVCVSMGCKVPFDICSKCASKAKNISLYCEHLKYAMNQVLPDGTQIYAVNTRPRFFDLSYVNKGAEKTAKVLKNLSLNANEIKKTASNKTFFFIADGLEKAASENRKYYLPSAYHAEMIQAAQNTKKKTAAIIKEVTPEPAKPNRADFVGPVLRAMDAPMPADTIGRLAKYPLASTCSTMSAMGMALHPQEMKRIIVIKIRGGARPDDIGAPRIGVDHIKPSLIQLLKAQLEKRSSFREPLRRRVLGLLALNSEQIMDKLAANEMAMNRVLSEKAEPGALEKAGPLAALAAAIYILYRKNIKKAPLPQFLQKAFGKYPELPAVVVGAGIGGAFGLAGQTLIRAGHEMTKKAISPLAKSVAGAAGIFAAPYLYSGYVQTKALRGEPIGKHELSAARHPGALGLAGLGAFLHRGYLKVHAKELLKKSRGLFKKGSVNIREEDILAFAGDNDLVDQALAVGLLKIAARIIEAAKQPV